MLFFPSQNVSLLGSGCTTVRLVRHFNGRGRMVLCAAELRGKPSKIVQLARQPTLAQHSLSLAAAYKFPVLKLNSENSGHVNILHFV